MKKDSPKAPKGKYSIFVLEDGANWKKYKDYNRLSMAKKVARNMGSEVTSCAFRFPEESYVVFDEKGEKLYCYPLL